jgi:hypothetical protein
MFNRSASIIRIAFVAVLTAVSAPSFAATALITAEEAALPPMKGAVANSNRGITRGPKITVVEGSAAVPSPIRFQVKFQPLGGSTIDLDGLKVTYLKQPNVDLTPRVKPFVQPTGIDMPDALLPPGDHLVRIDVKDSEGRVSTTSFLLKIAP